MTLENFHTLDEMEQHEAVWEGTCMGYSEEAEYKIITYKVSDFYVELYYHIEHNVLKKLKTIEELSEDIISKMNPATLYE